MGIEATISIWLALSSAIYFSFLFIARTKIDNIFQAIIPIYIDWFSRFFNVQKHGTLLLPSFRRSALLSLSISLIFAFAYEVFTAAFSETFSRQNFVNFETEYNPKMLFLLVLVFALPLFANIASDYLSVCQSYIFGKMLRQRTSTGAIFALVFLDICASVSFAFLSMVVSILTCVSVFIIGEPWANGRALSFSWPYNLSSFAKLYDLVRHSIEMVFITHYYDDLTWQPRALPFVVPVFLSSLITNVWFFLFGVSFFCLRSLRMVRLWDGHLDAFTRSHGGGSVLGALAVVVFSLIYWTSLLLREVLIQVYG